MKPCGARLGIRNGGKERRTPTQDPGTNNRRRRARAQDLKIPVNVTDGSTACIPARTKHTATMTIPATVPGDLVTDLQRAGKIAGLQNLGGRLVCPPPEKSEPVLSIETGCADTVLVTFPSRTKHPVLTRPISNPQNPFAAPNFRSLGKSATRS